MSSEKFHLVAIDLKFNRIYVILADQTRQACDQIVRDWAQQNIPDIVPVIWPANTQLPQSLFAA